MIRFVVVDDDKEEIVHIKSLLDEVVKEDKEVLSFSKFNTELKKEIENKDVRKVYILDVELNDKISGINIAKLIRDTDYENEILFITNHDSMFESVHRGVYEVFDFIEKFHDFDKRFKKDIKDIIKRNFDNKMFNYKVNTVELSIYYQNFF
ncbi:MAG: response regulator [Bacilli bacterium]|nr:response regulator [Bacilli bacterium]